MRASVPETENRKMRDDHHDIQTPKKDQLSLSSNRKPKPVNDPSKKLHHQQQKSIKKNLNSVFTSITEDDTVSNLSEKESIEKISSISKSVDADESIVEISLTSLNSNQTLVSENVMALQHSLESIGISPISEAFVFDKDQSGKSIESYILSLNQFVSPSSTTVGSASIAETTPFSSMSTVEMTPSSSSSAASPITAEPAQPFITKEETEMDSVNPGSLVKHLRKSMSQVLHSADIDHRYKKLLDALVKMMIEELFSFHEEKDMVVELFSKKVKTFLVSFVFCILVVSSCLILFSDIKSSYNGPPPT